MTESGPGLLSDKVRTVLKAAACDMAHKKWDSLNFVKDIVVGVIRTQWHTHTVGARSGVLFRAHIDCDDGIDFKVNFLLSEDDLVHGAKIIQEMEESGQRESGLWVAQEGKIPLPELYQFYDLRGRGRHLN